MVLTDEQYNKLFGNENEVKQKNERGDNLKTSQSISPKILELREQLEIKRINIENAKLDAELEKVKQGATSDNNLYTRILDMERKHHEDLLKMTQDNFNVRLEVEKAKLLQSNDGNDNYLAYFEMLAPYLPQILGKTNTPDAANLSSTPLKRDNNEVHLSASGNNPKQEIIGGVNMQITDVENYKKAIREGKINEEQGYKDFCEQMPDYAHKITREQFNTEFKKIQEGKL